MRCVRPAIAADPRLFGRGMARARAETVHARSHSGDLKLFATTFAAGFIFVSVFLA